MLSGQIIDGLGSLATVGGSGALSEIPPDDDHMHSLAALPSRSLAARPSRLLPPSSEAPITLYSTREWLLRAWPQCKLQSVPSACRPWCQDHRISLVAQLREVRPSKVAGSGDTLESRGVLAEGLVHAKVRGMLGLLWAAHAGPRLHSEGTSRRQGWGPKGTLRQAKVKPDGLGGPMGQAGHSSPLSASPPKSQTHF